MSEQPMDPGTMILSAGLSLASKVIFSWIRDGKSRVKLTEADKAIADQARAEADILRVRVDDLERTARQMLNQAVTQTPGLGFAKSAGRSPVIVLDFNPKDPKSSKQLLADLQAQMSVMAASQTPAGDATAAPVDDESAAVSSGKKAPAFEILDENDNTTAKRQDGATKSARMLGELRQRVDNANDPRE